MDRLSIKLPLMILGAVALAGCIKTQTTAIPLRSDVVQIQTSGPRACGVQGTQVAAYKEAAKTTLKSGFDRFVILDAKASNDIRYVGSTPVYTTSSVSGGYYGNTYYGGGYANTYGNIYGSGQSTTSGGIPIYAGNYHQGFLVKMYKENGKGAKQAMNARAVLGPDWQNELYKDTMC